MNAARSVVARTSIVSRADLLLTIDRMKALRSERVVALMGYEWIGLSPSSILPGDHADSASPLGDSDTRFDRDAVRPPVDVVARPLEPARFWYPAGLTVFAGRRSPPPVTRPAALPGWPSTEPARPALRPLASWRELQSRLRASLGASLRTTELDTDAILRAVVGSHLPDPLPVLRRRRWGARLRVVVDRSQRLTPFWADQDLVLHALETLVPAAHLEVALTKDADPLTDGLMAAQPGGDGGRLAPGTVVLVLGDLGVLDLGDPALAQRWLELGRRLALAGCRAVVLMSGPLAYSPAAVRQHWRVLPWERNPAAETPSHAARKARAERLLRLCAPAVRLEPELLRAVRRMLPPGEADAGTEADAWQSGALSGRSPLGASFHPQAAVRLRAEFEAEAQTAAERKDGPAQELLARVLKTIRNWRHGGGIGFEVWAEEVVNLGPAARALLPDRSDVRQALDLFTLLDAAPNASGIDPRLLESWLRRVAGRASESAKGHLVVDRALRNATRTSPGQYQPSAQRAPRELDTDDPERAVVLLQAGESLCIANDDRQAHARASPLARLTTANGLLRLSPGLASPLRIEPGWPTLTRSLPMDDELEIESDHEVLHFARMTRPDWASAIGRDQYGLFAEFELLDGGAIQRLRWIPPGRFWMGSPVDEEGRWKDEGPRHQVVLAEGYWLFDTPCTQAIWVAVMGENPSDFRSPTRPVEQVSFEDVQVFLNRVNRLVPGLELDLPSEAQWEYACRAGTDTATYAGPLWILGEHSAPALDAIAWYDGNIRLGFESDNELDSRGSQQRFGTQPVGLKRPNAWGLHDMLGNVWEWCSDHWHKSYEGAPADGAAWLDDAAGAATLRVVRSGSSTDPAPLMRSAYRYRNDPAFSSSALGFRCARVQGASGASRWNRRKQGARSAPAATPRPERVAGQPRWDQQEKGH